MALTQDFDTSQVIGSPSVIVLEDTSTGTDAAVTTRRIYITDSEGNYVVPSGTTTDYVVFPVVSLIGDTIDIDCLDFDMAVSITVQWLNVSGTVLYSKTHLKRFTLYNETFYYSLTQAQATTNQPFNLIHDTAYYSHKLALRVEIDNGNNAVDLADDILTAQECYDRATLMVTNENQYF